MTPTIVSNFWGDVVEELAMLAVTGNEIVDGGHIYVSDDIEQKRAIPRIAMTQIIQDAAATPISQGSFNQDERVLDPDEFMVYLEFNPQNYRTFWSFGQPRGPFVFSELAPKIQADLLKAIMEGSNGVHEYLGTAIWQGDKAAGAAPYNKFNGIITKALADSEVLDVAGYAAITAVNVADQLQKVYDTTRVATRMKSNYKIFMSKGDSEKYAQFQKAQAYKGVDVTSGGIMKFNGINIYPMVGIPDNTIIGTLADTTIGSNIHLGAQAFSDTEQIQVDKLQNNSDLWFFKMKMALDTQIKFGADFTLHHS